MADENNPAARTLTMLADPKPRESRRRSARLAPVMESGQAMLELVIVLPAFLVTLLSIVQLTEVVSARLATGWAARLAARAAAVHIDSDPDRMAERAAIRALGPFLPPLSPSADSASAAALGYVVTAALYEGAANKVANPVAAKLQIAFADGKPVSSETARKRIQDGEGASVEVVVSFDMPLRVPLANRIFSDTDRPGRRRLQATGRFPVMYAGGGEE